MVQSQGPDCLAKLRAEYDDLNPATKKVAEHILNNPGDVIEYNIVRYFNFKFNLSNVRAFIY